MRMDRLPDVGNTFLDSFALRVKTENESEFAFVFHVEQFLEFDGLSGLGQEALARVELRVG